jgi:thiamine kinase-like enzyme
VDAVPGHDRDGQPLNQLALTPVAEREAHRQAGKLLHRLHHAGPPRAEPDMTGWLAHRGEEWLRLAQPVLPREQLAEIRSHLQALAQLAPIAAVACHLDYAPRNLLRSPAGVISIIDFEHARYDLAGVLCVERWQDRDTLGP